MPIGQLLQQQYIQDKKIVWRHITVGIPKLQLRNEMPPEFEGKKIGWTLHFVHGSSAFISSFTCSQMPRWRYCSQNLSPWQTLLSYGTPPTSSFMTCVCPLSVMHVLHGGVFQNTGRGFSSNLESHGRQHWNLASTKFSSEGARQGVVAMNQNCRCVLPQVCRGLVCTQADIGS